MRVQPPILTSSDCEGAGEVFVVSPHTTASTGLKPSDANVQRAEFFSEATYLTVSSQLHLEAYMHELSKVWTMSPTFRAEKSDTPRHVSEFWMLEVELRTQSLSEVMDTVENILRHLVKSLRRTMLFDELCVTSRGDREDGPGEEAKTSEMLARRWQGLMKPYWPRIAYTEAMQLLTRADSEEEHHFTFKPTWDKGIQLEHERFIVDLVGHGGPVFITNYPRHLKPFYMLPTNDDRSSHTNDPRTVACFDLILPEICEVVGGSLREHRLDVLQERIHRQDQHEAMTGRGPDDIESNSHSRAPQQLDWYMDLRRYGSVPHGGFGLGFDRLLAYLAGVQSVKEIIPWPRYYGHCSG